MPKIHSFTIYVFFHHLAGTCFGIVTIFAYISIPLKHTAINILE